MISKIVITTLTFYLSFVNTQDVGWQAPKEISCLLPCEFGYETADDGKSICLCIDPCKKLACPRGTHCELIHQLYCPLNYLCPKYAYGCVKDCVQCTLKCPYGFKIVNGQQICECYWPCEGHICRANSFCKPYQPQCLIAPCPWIPQCYPRHNSCHCWGDPHCHTFDNAGSWDNQITCEYVASMTTASGVPPFTILVKNYKINPTDTFAIVEYVKIIFAGDTVHLSTMLPLSQIEARINTLLYALPYTPASAQYTVSFIGAYLIFQSTNGIKVTFGYSYFKIELPYLYSNLTTGWCGNFDGNAENDKYDKNGYAVSDPGVYNMGYLAESWVYNPAQLGTKECATVPNKQIDCTLPTTKCDFIYRAPFDKCTAKLDPDFVANYHKSCIFDVQTTCLATQACDVLASYAAICAQNGFYFNWRQATDCPCKCADRNADCSQQFATCGIPTCQNPNGVCSIESKMVPNQIDVCICKLGYYLWKGICVPREKCGCVDENGLLRDIGETWTSLLDVDMTMSDKILPACSIRNTCNANGLITSVRVTCPIGTTCIRGMCRRTLVPIEMANAK